MDVGGFYALVAAIEFTLLGLWWVAVKDRADVIGGSAAMQRAAYLVSLQFVIPGSVALLAQVAPDVTAIWRAAFAVAGVIGAVGIVLLSREIQRTSDTIIAPTLFVAVGAPTYVLVSLVAVAPQLTAVVPLNLQPIQIEAMLISALIFLGVQEAWVVSMTSRFQSR